MNRQFKLITQNPKPKEIGVGVIDINKDGRANFFEGNGETNACRLAELLRIRLEIAAADGILLSGMELKGNDKRGVPKYIYQEWWLVYIGDH